MNSSITFFKPLPEESGNSRTTIFNSVINFFRPNKGEKLSIEATPVEYSHSINSSEAEGFLDDFSNPDHLIRTSSMNSLRSSEDRVFRPRSLNTESSYRSKDDEFDLRLKHISSLFRDFPKNVLKNHQTFKKNVSVSHGDLRRYWMPDKHCHECYDCGGRFNTFRRRHHCRICGHIFCSRCCYQQIPGRYIGHAGLWFCRV